MGQLCAFVGHSGVGKSSLLDALAPGLALRTGDVRDYDGKGRHTTTLVELERGARVIDTPGIRSIGFLDLERSELVASFPELLPFTGACR